MKPITKILFLFASLFTGSALAQPKDYVILSNNDTVKCEINIPFMGAKNYRTDSTGKKVKITPEFVKEYYVSRKNIHQRSVYRPKKDEPVFMTVVERGKISLYQLVYTSAHELQHCRMACEQNTDTVTALKTSGLFMNRSKQDRMDHFKELIADNKDVYDKYVAEDKFNFRQLSSLVHLYNTGKLLTPEPEKKEEIVKKDDTY